jgi:site-specific DNA recombinase
MMRVAIYVRQSLDRTGEGLGVARQESECRRHCEYKGWEIAHVLSENDTSASVGKRPVYARMKAMIEQGEIDVVVVLRIDRLLRKMTDLEDLIELTERTGVLFSTVEGDLDLSQVTGRTMARFMATVARAEVETKSARQKLSNKQRAESGLPHAGRRAYGYQSDGMTIREDEALVLKDIAHRFLDGWTYTEIANHLNAAGYQTALGNRFVPVAVRQLLMRTRYAGIRIYNGVEYQGAWPAIYDEDTWRRIQLRIEQRTEAFSHRPRARRYLLTGWLVCGGCGERMNGGVQRAYKSDIKRTAYRCCREFGCGKVSRGAIPLDHLIKEMICLRLDSPVLADLIVANRGSREEAEKLLNERAAIEAKLTSLLNDYTDDTLTKAEYQQAKARATASLQRVSDQIMALHQSDSLSALLSAGESVRSRWEVESDGWRRQLIDLLIEKIVVKPSLKKPRYYIDGQRYYFDTESIDVGWRM